MNLDSNTLSERVTTSFSKLTVAAKDLNKVSDELGKAISSIDSILQRLNLGVPTWTQIQGGEDPHSGMVYWSRDVGYAKIGNRWGIALCTREGDYSSPDEERCESWLFNDAPRWLRVEGIEKIPDLLEELIKNTEETTKKIKGKIDQAKQLADSLALAAAGKPIQKKPVVSIPAVDVNAVTNALSNAGASVQIASGVSVRSLINSTKNSSSKGQK